MPVPHRITDLVDDFSRRTAFYKGPGYNETRTRIDFINPFFVELGWDVENKDREFEVIHEGKLANPMTDEHGKRRRAPDYIFWYGPQRRFVVEAKKPAVPIKNNADAALQVRSYGWSAQVPLAILTDFEEFAIYDTRYPPIDGESANMGLINYYSYDQYPQVWDDISALFSRKAVIDGSLDQYIQSVKPKRPTIPVDAAFLKEIEGWRSKLAINIAGLNAGLDVRQLNRFVQMTIDRIIFLRFCEERGIEDYERLKRLTEGGGSIYPQLVNLFQQADERYNSGLFHFKKEAGRDQPDEADLRLKIGNPPLLEMIAKLYPPTGPYAFGVIPVEIIGQVYEQFLGKVITLSSSHTAEVEDKPEVRKAGGVYYTPQYIVDYIVEHTIGKLVKGKQPKQIASVRILDPACGSGSFLVGAYSYLLEWYRKWYAKHSPEKYSDELYDLGGGQWRLTTRAKKDILLRHIYGVDIDTQAVEVTKLSLMLKMLEDESDQTLQYRLFTTERVLPNLDDNIKCGNSLIGKDFFNGQTPTAEERRRVNAFDWAAAFPAIVKYNDKREMVGGFDAVIGNPPYIRIQTMIDEPQGEQILGYYKHHFAAAAKGNYDIYVLFVEQGLQMLGKAGRLGYILPHKFFNAKYGEPLRGLLANGKHLAEVIHFGDQQVFAKATTYTTLLFLDKQGSDEVKVTKVADLSAWRKSSNAASGTIPASQVNAAEWNFAVGSGSALFDRMSGMPVKLGGMADIFVGLQTSADDIFIMSLVSAEEESLLLKSKELNMALTFERGLLFPLVSGTDVGRYKPLPERQYILFPYDVSGDKVQLLDFNAISALYPHTAAYLLKNRQKLEDREKGKFRDSAWYRYGRNQNIGIQNRVKLCVPRLVDKLHAAYDEDGKHFLDNVDVGGVTLKPGYEEQGLLYLLGLLNCSLLRWYFPHVSAPFRGGFRSANRQFLSQLPIRTLNLSNPTERGQHERMVQLVQQMLDLKRQEAAGTLDGPTRETMRDIDWAIDQLVYQLYGLTADEIKIVEAATKLATTIPLSAPTLHLNEASRSHSHYQFHPTPVSN